MMTIKQIEREVEARHEKKERGTWYYENLQDKNIKDFTPEDTVYATLGDSQYPVTYLCQFLGYKGGRVQVRALISTINPEIYYHKVKAGYETDVLLDKISLYGSFEENDNAHYHSCNVLGNFRSIKALQNDNADHTESHESFGLISFSKGTSSGAVPLFGSSIKHNNIITLQIKNAEVDRKLGRDWIHSKKSLIEVMISSAQFAELISSFNTGEGTPCTIRSVGGERYELPQYENKLEQSQQEFAKKMQNIAQSLDNILEESKQILEDKKPIGKAGREHILSALRSISQNLSSNVPFITSSFSQQMEKTITEAKLEIESFVQNKGIEINEINLLGE